ncbi:hypothetical protein QUA43_05710 [Microcoleus sp. N9_B4]|uniref:hypothetical protein n=1 Tax=Microcoleus sp. N9_B4 TaxID=3055386 RepID=UPI002FD5BDA0
MKRQESPLLQDGEYFKRAVTHHSEGGVESGWGKKPVHTIVESISNLNSQIELARRK